MSPRRFAKFLEHLTRTESLTRALRDTHVPMSPEQFSAMLEARPHWKAAVCDVLIGISERHVRTCQALLHQRGQLSSQQARTLAEHRARIQELQDSRPGAWRQAS